MLALGIFIFRGSLEWNSTGISDLLLLNFVPSVWNATGFYFKY